MENNFTIVDVDSVECIGEFKDDYVYDIEMCDDTEHTFFANNILIHNSVYFTLDHLIENGMKFLGDDGYPLPHVYDIISDIEDHLNKGIIEWGKKSLFSQDCRFLFKREIIGDAAVFLEKKRYVIRKLDEEGIKEKKFKYAGVEVVRTNIPSDVKPMMKEIIEIMLIEQDKDITDAKLKEVYDKHTQMKPDQIASVMGVKEYTKWQNSCKINLLTKYGRNANIYEIIKSVVKGMPIHVKAAYYHNHMLDELGISDKYKKIGDGDKIRYFYCDENQYKIKVIGFMSQWPEEFNKIFHINSQLVFEKQVFNSISRFYDSVGWKPQIPNNNVEPSVFDLF